MTGCSAAPAAGRCSSTRSASFPGRPGQAAAPLQEMEVRPVGSSTPSRSDRVIAATNRDLSQAVSWAGSATISSFACTSSPSSSRRWRAPRGHRAAHRALHARLRRPIGPHALYDAGGGRVPDSLRLAGKRARAGEPRPPRLRARGWRHDPAVRHADALRPRSPQDPPRRRSNRQVRPRGRKGTCSRTARWKRSATRSARRTATSARPRASSASESPRSTAR